MPNATSTAAAAALDYVDQHREALLDELKAFLRIPSISTLPKHKKDIRRAATFVANQMKAVGLRKVKVIKTQGNPLVYGEWLDAPGKPTILIYGHYDVQPVDPLDDWVDEHGRHYDPFEPEIRHGNIYARGAADDKGQTLALLEALQALMATGEGRLPANVRFLVEGEEEVGGASIEAYVREHPEALACDAVLIADTPIPAPNVPALIYGVRGILYTEFAARGARRDLHSGGYGGVAPNPLHALALVLAGLKGSDGRITIPELYKRLRGVDKQERELWQRNPLDLTNTLKEEMGLDVLPGEEEIDPRERLGARPTLEVHGVKGGFTGEGAKTVIPAEATAKVSLRLPPELTPDEVLPLLRKRVEALTPKGVKITVNLVHSGRGVLVPIDNVYVRAAERALEQEWGKAPIFEREGGSIPIAALFDSVLRVPIIFAGTGLPDDNIHAPNEKYALANFYHLIRQTVRFLQIVGTDPAIVARPAVQAKTRRPRRPSAKSLAATP